MRLKDKVAIITGGSSGIGFAVAKAYLKEGAKVVIASFDKDEVLSSVKELDSLNVLGTVCDVKKTEDVKRVVSETLDKFGRIDILVNNAGITNSGLTENVSDEDFINMFDVNTSSMVANDGSRMQTAYSASKYAVNGITKSCAKELGAFNIRVNAVAPGAVMTNMVKGATTPEMREMLCKTCALNKIAEPEELAGAYVYLGSDEASFTTGVILRVDGATVM